MAKMGGKRFAIDMTEIEEYQEALQKFGNEFDDFCKRYLNALAGQVMERVIPRTPVDTGLLRRSWKVIAAREVNGELQVDIINDASQSGPQESYASYIEFGHLTVNGVTWVEGRFMLTTSTDEVKLQMQRVWSTMFKRECRRRGI